MAKKKLEKERRLPGSGLWGLSFRRKRYDLWEKIKKAKTKES